MDFGFQSGIWGMLSGATLVVQGVLILLVAMSFGSWVIIFCKFFVLNHTKKNIIRDIEVFKRENGLNAAINSSSQDADNPCSPSFRGVPPRL